MSKFKRRHLDALNDPSKSYLSPLDVIVHLDLDAYYAQCEQVRLNLPPEAPVVCRQWHSLIAVNYPARKYGIKRGDSIQEARKKCEDLHAPHVATYKKGETTWKYHEHPNTSEYKVSLDAFRQKSRRIFKVFKDYCSVIEKAGIDEGFLDMGQYLYRTLIDMFPDQLGASSADKDDDLPPAPTEVGLNWNGVMVGDDSGIYDWDDICVLIASNRVAEIRQALKDAEHITCSAGIAQNKILAKLGSAKNKPNNQTIVTSSTLLQFLQEFKLTDMWGMGGKYGDRIMGALEIGDGTSTTTKEEMEYLQNLSLEDLQQRVGQNEGQRIYNLVRGRQTSEIVTRTDVKSMQSVKQFTGSSAKALKTIEDCQQWIKVFAADLANRVLELDDDAPVPLRPKTVVLGHGMYTKLGKNVQHSKQIPFKGMSVDDKSFEKYFEELYEAGKSLLLQLKSEHVIFPVAMLRLAVTSMEKVEPVGSTRLEAFFGKSSLLGGNIGSKGSVKKTSQDPVSSLLGDKVGSQNQPPEPHLLENEPPEPHQHKMLEDLDQNNGKDQEQGDKIHNDDQDATLMDDDDLFVTEETLINCERCKEKVVNSKMDEHRDWHFAKDLQQRLQQQTTPTKRPGGGGSNQQQPKKLKKSTGDQSIFKFFAKKSDK